MPSTLGRLAGRWRRGVSGTAPGADAADQVGRAQAAGPSPVELSLRRVWARRELYTLAIPQAHLDLSQSPLAPGGQVFTTVPVEGEAVVATYEAGALVLRPQPGAGPSETYHRLFAMQPFATVEADLALTGSATARIEWRSADGDVRVTVSADRASGTIGAELRVSGSVVAALPPTTVDLDGELTLLAQLQGRSVLVWHRRGRATTYVGRLGLAPHLDLRAAACVRTWSLGLTVRGEGGAEVRCTRLAAALSGNGHADPRVVAYEDGTPISDGTVVWFLATTRGAEIADAFQGVYALDTATGTITMTGALFGERDGDGIWRNENAGHLLYDRDTRRWTWFAISHSDHPGRRGTYVGSSTTDLRHGVHLLPVEQASMPVGSALWEDVYPVRDGDRWFATASKNARHTAWLESDAIAGPWVETQEAAGNDETGQLLVRSGGRRYVVAGTATTAFIIRDADVDALTELGHLDVDVDTGGARVWPALFALEDDGRLRWFMLSFDRTSPAERYSYGRLHLYRDA